MASKTIKEYLVRMGVDSDAEALARWDKGVQRAKGHMMDMAKVAAGLAAGTAAVGTALAREAKKAAEWGDTALKTSKRTGIAAESIQKLRHAAQLSDADLGALQRGLKRLNRTANDAQMGLSSAKDSFRQLNLEWKNAQGELKGTEQLLLEASERISQLDSRTQKVALAQELFGRGGAELLPLLEQGVSGIQQMMQEADDLGATMENDTAKAGRALLDNWTRLQATIDGLRRSLGAQLIPVLNDLIQQFRGWVEENRELIEQRIDVFAERAGVAFRSVGEALQDLDSIAQEHGGWGAFLQMIFTWSKRLLYLWATAKIAGTVGGVADAVGGLGAALTKASLGTSSLSQAMTGATPVGWALVAALAGTAYIAKEIWDFQQGKESLFGPILKGTKKQIDETTGKMETVKATIGEIQGALDTLIGVVIGVSSAIAYLAVAVAGVGATVATTAAGIVVGIVAGAATIYAYWDRLGVFFSNLWLEIRVQAEQAWNAVVSKTQEAATGVVSWFTTAKNDLFGLWDDITAYIQRKIDQMLGWLTDFSDQAASLLGFDVQASATMQGRPNPEARPAAAGAGPTNIRTGDTQVNVKTQPGQDEEEIARRVEEKRRQEERKKHRKVAEKLARGGEQ